MMLSWVAVHTVIFLQQCIQHSAALPLSPTLYFCVALYLYLYLYYFCLYLYLYLTTYTSPQLYTARHSIYLSCTGFCCVALFFFALHCISYRCTEFLMLCLGTL